MNIKLARDLVYARSSRVCERCGARPGTNWHHRRAAGRVWTPENGLDLCGSGTTGCHGWVTDNPVLAKAYGWSVSNYRDPRWTPVLVWRRWCYLTPTQAKVVIPRPLPSMPDVALAFPDMAQPPHLGGLTRGGC